MNENPFRSLPATSEAEEPTPDFQSPGSWSLSRRILALMLAGLLGIFFPVWGNSLPIGVRLVLSAAVTLVMLVMLVLGPVLERWRARRNARAVARLMSEP